MGKPILPIISLNLVTEGRSKKKLRLKRSLFGFTIDLLNLCEYALLFFEHGSEIHPVLAKIWTNGGDDSRLENLAFTNLALHTYSQNLNPIRLCSPFYDKKKFHRHWQKKFYQHFFFVKLCNTAKNKNATHLTNL